MLFPVLGLAPPPVGVSVFTPLWVIVLTVLVRYAMRQQVTRRGQSRRLTITFGSWALAYAGALVIGELLFMGVATYWVPMAAVVAAPFFAGAWWTGRT